MITKVVRAGPITRYETYSIDPRHGPGAVRLDADRYMVVSTGEIGEYTHAAHRADGDAIKRLRQSMRDLRDVINANVADPQDIAWATLTYADNMTDPVQLYQDHRRYWQRLKRYLSSRGAAIPEYVVAAEPQGRGAWHLHCLYFFPRGARPYIPNDDLARIWGHGYTTIDRVNTRAGQDVDNIGVYLSAYLTDTVADTSDPGDKRKSVIKGGRLHMYPPRMRFWRASRGAARPTVEWMEDERAKKDRPSAGTLAYHSTAHVRLPSGQEITITYDHYSVGKSSCQDVDG